MINPFIRGVQHTLPASQNQNLGKVILCQQRKCSVDDSRFPPIRFPVPVTDLGEKKTNPRPSLPALTNSHTLFNFGQLTVWEE